jgi:hypothetical protein
VDSFIKTSPDVKPAAADSASNTRSWRMFAELINDNWGRGADHFIACGQHLLAAKEELAKDAFAVMIKAKLAFDASVARRLMRIASNHTLCSHANRLPPCWTSLYELSKLNNDVLEAKLADGTIHPGMQRKDASALCKPKSQAKTAAVPKSEILAVWKAASVDQRRHFLDQLGRDGLCAAMSAELQADLRDHIISVTIAGASKSTSFATYATDKLHTALRCAEQPEPDAEGLKHMVAALGCILKKANAKGVSRSDVVIAEGKPIKRRK